DPPAKSPPPRKADRSGSSVDPASGGTGAPGEPNRPMIPRSRWFIAFLLGLLVVNLVISFVTSGPAQRQRIPYQPFFVDQIKAGNVSEISSQQDSIEGELKHEATYDPPGDAKPVTVTSFETEVPTFIDHTQVTRLLNRQDVVV